MYVSAVGRGGRFHREIFPLRQLVWWVEFLASDAVRASFDDELGLSLWVEVAVDRGALIAQSIVDQHVQDMGSGTQGASGAWFGPASLINCACADCANATFKLVKCGKVVEVRAARKLAPGTEVLVAYVQGAPVVCARAGCNRVTKHVAREDVEESEDDEREILPKSKRARENA